MTNFISTTIATILGIILAFAFWAGFDKLNTMYYQAEMYSQMTTTERFTMMIMDREHYDTLVENYTFISGLPIIGETL